MIMMVKDKPKSVILWGLNDFAKQYIDTLREIGISIKFIIDPNEHSNVYKDIKIVSLRQVYKEEINASENIPMVITDEKSFDSESADFKSSLIESLDFLGDKNIKILHPCFIAQYLGLDLRNNVLITGCNRSGNTLLFNIIKQIKEKTESPGHSSREFLLAKLTENHFNSIQKYLDDIFINKDRCLDRSRIGSTTFKSINYFDSRLNEFLYMSPIASDRYLFDRVHRTHSVIDNNLIDYAQKNNYQIIFTMRNPLDIIVSNAFQFENIFINMYPDEVVDEPESPFRDQYGLSNLNNMEWFESMAGVVKKYMDAFLERQQDVGSAKYEDLITRPVETILRLANQLSVDVDESFAASLWEKISFKPLSSYKSHMFRPGKDKWKEYMTKRHMDILKTLNYPKLTKLLDYNIDYRLNSNTDIYDNLSTSQTLKKTLAIRDILMNIQFNKPINFADEQISRMKYTDLGYECNFVSNSSVFLNSFKKASTDKIFEKMLSSSFL